MPSPLPDLPLLLSPEALEPWLGHPDLLIIDTGQEASFAYGHIPGAVHLPPRALVSGLMPAPGALPPREQVEWALAHCGWRPGCHVVACDDEGGGWAGRLLWTLETAGIGQYSLLDGGIHAWRLAGLPQSTDLTHSPQPAAPLPWSGHAAVDKTYLLTHLRDPDLIIWDARSQDEYLGNRVTALRNGHIPGAVNYDWTWAMDPQRGLRIRDMDKVRNELAQRGITAERTVVTHCHSHHRSGFTWILGRILGFPRMLAYPGSWSEWGNDPETPIVQGSERF